MISKSNYWLGSVLHKVTGTHEIQVRLELREGGCRFLSIAKFEMLEGELNPIGWVDLYARNLGPLRRGLRKAHQIAANWELGDSDAVEFPCELDGKSWAESTRKVRIILDHRNGAKALTLRPYCKIGDGWYLQDGFEVVLGLDDLNDIVEALDTGTERFIDATTKR